MSLHTLLLLVLGCRALLPGGAATHCPERPHIVVMMADDLGWNDVGMHGSAQIPTPNIDAIAYNGHGLHRHYTMHICTPSRAAFLTGNYPIRNGMQGTPLRPGEKREISPQVLFLSSRLKEQHYQTHLVGKWHLGHYSKKMTPLGRGFDKHLGYYNGFCGYFDYSTSDTGRSGYDLHRDNFPEWRGKGVYATELFTREAESIIEHHNACRPLFLFVAHLAAHTGANGTALEVPDPAGADRRFAYVKEPPRRRYAEIVRLLDESAGRIMAALANKKMLHNSIVLWFSDNGGQTRDPFYGYSNYASNYPQRGMKFSLYEGGVRNVGVLWSPLLKHKQYVNRNPIHIVDWLPTFYAAAGGNVADLGDIDGRNQWSLLTGRDTSPPERPDILLNIDEVLNYEGVMTPDGHYKLLNGTFPRGDYDGYYGDTGRNPEDPSYDVDAVLRSSANRAVLETNTQPALTAEAILRMREDMKIVEGPGPRVKTSNCTELCLYDLQNDPTEKLNVKDAHPEVMESLLASLRKYRARLVPQKNKLPDPSSDPAKCNNVWFTWEDRFNLQCWHGSKEPSI